MRISCPSWAPGQRLAEHLAEYRRRFPEVVVDVSFEDRMVDLVEEGYDLASAADVLGRALAGPHRPTRAPVSYFLAASTEYIKRNGAPKSPEELARHDFVAVGNVNSLQLIGASGKIEVPMRVVLRYRSALGVANAVASGIGLAPLPAILFEDPALKTRLTPVLMEYPLRQSMLYLVYVSRKYLPLEDRHFPRLFGGTHFADAGAPAARPRRSLGDRSNVGGVHPGPDGRAGLTSTRVMAAHAAPAFTGMKRCMNQTARCSNRKRQIQ